ncbi:hypothetical protein BDC45DRAFT_533644 [Circinella umbellata]|nr:hypothetical protein BDC45DRAFT_533644 [Circinella umbellata]
MHFGETRSHPGISRRRNLTKNGQGSTGRVTVLGVNIYFPKYSNLNEESDLFFNGNIVIVWFFIVRSKAYNIYLVAFVDLKRILRKKGASYTEKAPVKKKRAQISRKKNSKIFAYASKHHESEVEYWLILHFCPTWYQQITINALIDLWVSKNQNPSNSCTYVTVIFPPCWHHSEFLHIISESINIVLRMFLCGCVLNGIKKYSQFYLHPSAKRDNIIMQ